MDVAFQYLMSQPGVKRDVIGAGGASCGVNQSIQLARRHPEVKSLVLLSGNTDRVGRQFLRQSAKLPVFIAAADDDDGVVPYMQWLLSLSENPGDTFQRYSVGGHGTDMFAAHNELPGMIVSWFDTTLLKTPGSAPASSAASRPSFKDGAVLDLIDEPGGANKAAEMLAKARQHDPKAVLFPENIVNLIGYEHIQAGDTKGAVEIFKLNASAFPNSANVYDSLSDAYLADGQTDLARQNAEKALNALGADTAPEDRRKLIKASAEQKLKQLNAKAH
jgi:tetratricopeptide (TPR) repeat protein